MTNYYYYYLLLALVALLLLVLLRRVCNSFILLALGVFMRMPVAFLAQVSLCCLKSRRP